MSLLSCDWGGRHSCHVTERVLLLVRNWTGATAILATGLGGCHCHSWRRAGRVPLLSREGIGATNVVGCHSSLATTRDAGMSPDVAT